MSITTPAINPSFLNASFAATLGNVKSASEDSDAVKLLKEMGDAKFSAPHQSQAGKLPAPKTTRLDERAKSAANLKSTKNAEASEDAKENKASASVLDTLSQVAREEDQPPSHDSMGRHYDPLECIALLDNEISRQSDPQKRELLLKAREDVLKAGGDKLTQALHEADQFGDALSVAQASATKTDGNLKGSEGLRDIYSAKPGKPLEAIPANQLFDKLLDMFGADGVDAGLTQLQNNTAKGSRTEAKKEPSERLVLSMQDLKVLQNVRSMDAIARDMRTGFSIGPNVLPLGQQAHTCKVMLDAVHNNETDGNALVSKLVNLDGVDALSKAKIFSEANLAVKKIPTTFWQDDTTQPQLAESLANNQAGSNAAQMLSVGEKKKQLEAKMADLLQKNIGRSVRIEPRLRPSPSLPQPIPVN